MQQIEEANTANILLHLGGPSNDQTDTMSDEDLSSSSSSMQPCTLPNVLSNKGNIIDQLRSTIRAETASRISHMLDGRTKVSTLSTNASSSSSPIPFHSSVLSSTTSIEELVAQAHAEAEAAMDDDVDDESVQSGHTDAATSQNNSSSSGSSATSTPSTALSGGIKATENFHSLRKERNRIHAKLTRDRKKLFTTRLQQMINTLERQNSQLRHRLLKSTGTNNQSYPSPIQSVSGTMAAESLLGSAMYRTTSLPSDGGASRYANSWSRIGGSHDGSTDSSNSSSSGDSCSSGLSTSAANDIYLVDRNRRMSV